MTDLCEKIEVQSPNKQCKQILQQHENFLNSIKIDENYLKHIKTARENRRKRSAPLGSITTYVFKPVFGIMDEDDADQLISKINAIIDNQKTHKIIIEENLSIMHRTIEIINGTTNDFRKNMHELEQFINDTIEQLKEMENNVELQIGFGNIAQMATNIRFEYMKSYDLIKRVLKQKFLGEYTEFVTYQKVIDDLKEVTQDLDESQIKPITDPEELQESISVLGTIRDKKLLIELTIPMVDRNIYTLFKLRTLPIQSQNELVGINIKHTLFLVQNETKTYIPLKEFEDAVYCKDISTKRKLCLPSRALQLADNQECESNLLFRSEPDVLLNTCQFESMSNITTVLELYENVFFIAPRGKTGIVEKCLAHKPEKTQVKQMGIIKINPNCELLVGSQRIIPFQHHVRSNVIDLPTFNLTKSIHIRDLNALSNHLDKITLRPKTIFLNYDEKLEALKNDTTKASETIRKSQMIDNIDTHSVRNGFICIGIAIILIIIVRRLCSCISKR